MHGNVDSRHRPRKHLRTKNSTDTDPHGDIDPPCVVATLVQADSSSSIELAWCFWSEEVASKIAALLPEVYPLSEESRWVVSIRHIEHVKSYAPHVDHIVVDLECRPRKCVV